MSKKEEITLEWKDVGQLRGRGDIELDLEEYAECVIDMQSLE